MGGYRVDLDRLTDIVDQIDRFNDHLQAALDDVETRVNRLHATWTGAAASAHRQAYDEWTRGVADMRTGLRMLRSNAQIAHGNHTNAVTTNTAMWEQAR